MSRYSDAIKELPESITTYDALYRVIRTLTKALIADFKDLNPGEVMTLAQALELVRPIIESHTDLVIDKAYEVQKVLNKKNGVKLNAVKAKKSEDRIDGIIKKLCSGKFADTSYILDSGLLAYTFSILDDTCKENAEQQYKAGITPVVERRMNSETCKWCQQWAGVWTYPDVPKQVYQRHRGCDCIVEYKNGKMAQNVHTRNWSELQPSEIVKKPGAALTEKQAEDYENYLKQKKRNDAIDAIATSRGITFEEARKRYNREQERLRDRARWAAGSRRGRRYRT